MSYRVNEVFYSVQGEGMRGGTANVFVRFTGCNLTCSMESHGFDCDTEFSSGRDYDLDDLLTAIHECAPPCMSVILTGGEPALQVDEDLVRALKAHGYYIAIETNGSKELLGDQVLADDLFDWITVSPKVAEHAVRQLVADEVKYVRGHGQAIPRPKCKAKYQLVSPAFDGLELSPRHIAWCVQLVKEHPAWRLSCQMHKLWRVR